MNREALKLEVVAAFKRVPKPAYEQIAPHECLECDEVRSTLDPYEATNVPDAEFEKVRGAFQLLSDEAKQYYFPAWLLRSIDEPESDSTLSVVFALGSDLGQPESPYTERQWKLFETYLEFIEGRVHEISLPEVIRAKQRLQGAS